MVFGELAFAAQEGFNPGKRDFFVATVLPESYSHHVASGFNPGKRDFFVATKRSASIRRNTSHEGFNPGKRDFFVATLESLLGRVAIGLTFQSRQAGFFCSYKHSEALIRKFTTDNVSIPASGIFL